MARVAGSRDVIAARMQVRNEVSRAFFAREAPRLAVVCRAMAERFQRGGRLLAFGRGAAATDAQHVAVEFVHPVLVGKRALPALDVSGVPLDGLSALLRADDILIGFAGPAGDTDVARALDLAARAGALTMALPGTAGEYAVAAASDDPFVHQEIVEILYHTLWETVHVFFEHRTLDHDAGAAAFLYPFLAAAEQPTDAILTGVTSSIGSKAAVVERLRARVADEQADGIVAAARALRDRIARGGTLLCFGNGGSATDANDLALDCVSSPKGCASIPAISLASDPATLTALANDLGAEAMFVRQLMAHGRPQDAVVTISTSGGSANIIAGLAEARRAGMLTVALVGYDGGEILRRDLADHTLVVPCDHIPRVQEVQASIYHVMLDLLSTAGDAS